MQKTRSFTPLRAAAIDIRINTVYRGGGWCVDPQEARLAYCSISDQAGRGPYLGFRLTAERAYERGECYEKEG